MSVRVIVSDDGCENFTAYREGWPRLEGVGASRRILEQAPIGAESGQAREGRGDAMNLGSILGDVAGLATKHGPAALLNAVLGEVDGPAAAAGFTDIFNNHMTAASRATLAGHLEQAAAHLRAGECKLAGTEMGAVIGSIKL